MGVQKTMKSEKEEKICPRCGSPYNYIDKRKVGDGVYYYAVHVEKTPEGRKVKKCYLGSGSYRYVEQFQNLNLSGLIDEKRYLRYAINILDKLNGEELQKLDGKLVMNFVLNIISKLDKEGLRVIWKVTADRLKWLKKMEAEQQKT
ncbi:MAG: hypothetical protein LM601_11530 [Candidatus Verstraetearchaeota archaeon]|nr:hypothetical protein [Candidatus Verstraetearchaeota archaeon]